MSDFYRFSGNGPDPLPGRHPRFEIGEKVRFLTEAWVVGVSRWRDEGFKYALVNRKEKFGNVSEEDIDPWEGPSAGDSEDKIDSAAAWDSEEI